MIVKVCGIKERKNVEQLAVEPIDLFGINFYPKSARYIEDVKTRDLRCIPFDKRIGVFVSSPIEEVKAIAKKWNLQYLQLHGGESPEYCLELAKEFKIIKVFSIREASDFDIDERFSISDFYLFDTKTILYGGSGEKFDWSLLNTYSGQVPFLLGGGISPDDADSLKSIKHPMFKGVDINSRFETKPGVKSVLAVSQFLKDIREK